MRNVLIKHPFLAAFLPAVLAFVLYLPATRFGFVNWDDGMYLARNYEMTLLDADFFWWAASSIIASNWHPLTIVSFALDFSIWGADPYWYHLENNLLHAINTLLAGLVATRLYRAAAPDGGVGAAAAGAVTALLFGLHPLHVESVAWVSERKDVLSGLFFLLTVFFYIDYARGEKSGKVFYGLALFSCLLALMSKPMAVTLPVVLLIIDFYPLGRFDETGFKKALIEKAPFFALALLFGIITLIAQRGSMGMLGALPPSTRVYVAVRGAFFYLSKTILPTGLAPLYPLFPWETSLISARFLVPLAALFAVTAAACLAAAKRNRAFIAAWAFYLVTLAPVSGIMQAGMQAAADRYSYLPTLGFFVLAGALAGKIFGAARSRLAKGAGVLVFLALTAASGALSASQINVWKDSVSLWSREIELYPYLASAYNNRAAGYREKGESGPALLDFAKAVEINPEYADVYAARAALFLKEGRLLEAAGDFNKAISLDPQSAGAYVGRAALSLKTGYRDEALSDLSTAVILDPGNADAMNNRGTLYARSGEFALAEADFRKAMALKPNYGEPRHNLALLLLKSGESARAEELFKTAGRLGTAKSMEFVPMGGY